MTTGERIRYYREQAGLTMEQLAQKIGVQNSAINKYEKGIVTNIPIDRIKKIAEALGVDPMELVDWGDEVDYYTFDEKQKAIKRKRMELRQLIDEAPEDVINFLDLLLRLPTPMLQELGKAITRTRDSKEL